ncbi:cytochrome C assembly family protein [Candidatus Methylocalor cossyra]|uniref:CcsA-related protein n=1 Tax=Candidatus Methylocalor cossyra TaxID=3108543 RepID=A0ABP1CBI4_9GAMM
MNSTLFGTSAILAYIASAVVMFRSLRPAYEAVPDAAAVQRFKVLAVGWFAAALHAMAMINLYAGEGGLDFSLLNALSAITWIIVAIVLVAALFRPLDKLGLVVFPLAAVILALKLSVPEGSHRLHEHSWPMAVHIVVSVLAYGFLNIAAIQAVLLAFQDWSLRSHHRGGLLIRSLPPLETMEAVLFQLIGAGFTLLSLSLVTGFLFLENMFAQHLAHKTILSLLAWILFAVLLAGRFRSGWRGPTAIRWTLGGFFALMLAYLGSKMVLEWILKRA